MSTMRHLERSSRTGIVNAATAPCRYGVVLVAASDKGICDIHLGTNKDGLVEGYHRSAKGKVSWIQSGNKPAWLVGVLNLIEDPTYTMGYPLEIQGTPFQKLVWAALCNVPVGQTTTYGELAKTVGKPKAYRAVGRACGANRLALAIPCHRALRKGSGPLDFRWGADIKLQVLAAESSGSDLVQRGLTY